MARISENQINRALLQDILNNRTTVNKFSREVTTGLKAHEPGDSKQSGTIADFRDTLTKIEGYVSRANFAEGFLAAQDNALSEAQNLLIRAKEVAAQAANEANGPEARASLAEEVFEIRDHLVTLANTTYLGRYVFSGNADNVPAYSRATDFPVPGDGSLADSHYLYNDNPGSRDQRLVQITDALTVPVNTPGAALFDNGLYALERLGRALAGYKTDPGSPNVPDPTLPAPANGPYTFPDEYGQQSQDIRDALDQLDVAREQDITRERNDLGGRMRRLETARSLLDLSKTSAQDILSKLQDADVTESASHLAQAQTALQAAFQVTTAILRTSILDFI